MLKHRLLAVAIFTSCGYGCGEAHRVIAGGDANSTSYTISVTPDAAAPKQSDAYFAAGDAVATAADLPHADAAVSTLYAAGEAVASDDTSAGSSTVNAAGSAASPAAVRRVWTRQPVRLPQLQSVPLRIYADVEAVFMQQTPRFRNQPILLDFLNGDALLASTSDLNFAESTGIEATFGLHLCNCRAVKIQLLRPVPQRRVGIFRQDRSEYGRHLPQRSGGATSSSTWTTCRPTIHPT